MQFAAGMRQMLWAGTLFLSGASFTANSLVPKHAIDEVSQRIGVPINETALEYTQKFLALGGGTSMAIGGTMGWLAYRSREQNGLNAALGINRSPKVSKIPAIRNFEQEIVKAQKIAYAARAKIVYSGMSTILPEPVEGFAKVVDSALWHLELKPYNKYDKTPIDVESPAPLAQRLILNYHTMSAGEILYVLDRLKIVLSCLRDIVEMGHYTMAVGSCGRAEDMDTLDSFEESIQAVEAALLG